MIFNSVIILMCWFIEVMDYYILVDVFMIVFNYICSRDFFYYLDVFLEIVGVFRYMVVLYVYFVMCLLWI